ncbi:uncharacterized protein LOC130054652 isoform X2 [Ostrea edulis]|uniref:uncharacterized protein LOC130054652 isoform X2 n=1 Tax=Ostrea edulis TaxID=37623 RepID=UPI0024AF1C5B|nr:uncharacterized protein LOC130054652 isoform X2 [Ostrea edulis]
MEALLFKVLLCTYPNGCSVCSKITLDNASIIVTGVDWTQCVDTREYNMIVKNSANNVLYQNSTSCCKGNITIYFDVDGSKMAAEETTSSKTAAINPIGIAVIIVSSVAVIIIVAFLILSCVTKKCQNE